MASSSRWRSRATQRLRPAASRRYHGFVRLKASSYFLAGGDSEDLIQEGLIGLYKAIRDYRTDRESSFRNFAELCITRQIITAVKTATRNKHTPLNHYVSFSSTPAGAGDDVPTLDELIPGPSVNDPANQVISSEELRSLVGCLSTSLSQLESGAVALPRRPLLRADRRAPRLRHQDRRQRAAARQAQGRRAPGGSRRRRVSSTRSVVVGEPPACGRSQHVPLVPAPRPGLRRTSRVARCPAAARRRRGRHVRLRTARPPHPGCLDRRNLDPARLAPACRTRARSRTEPLARLAGAPTVPTSMTSQPSFNGPGAPGRRRARRARAAPSPDTVSGCPA